MHWLQRTIFIFDSLTYVLRIQVSIYFFIGDFEHHYNFFTLIISYKFQCLRRKITESKTYFFEQHRDCKENSSGDKSNRCKLKVMFQTIQFLCIIQNWIKFWCKCVFFSSKIWPPLKFLVCVCGLWTLTV